MVKSFLIIVNLGITFMFVRLFGGVDVQYSFPSQVDSGGQFTVEFSINKGDVDKYARLTLEVPNGIKVTAKETAGGQFTFNEQVAVVHWYNLPFDEILKVTLVFTVAPAISGEVTVKGSFKYIEDNAIQEKTIGPNKIKIREIEGVTDLLASQRYKYREITLKPIDCIRQKPYMNENNEIEVNLLVSKSDLSNFGKIEEQVPRGYKAVATRTAGAIFQVSGRVIKFLWMELPKDTKMFLVSYKLTQIEDYGSQAFIINGTFSYSQFDRNQTIPINERNIDLLEFAADELLLLELSKDEQLEELAKESTQKRKDVLSDGGTFTGTNIGTSKDLENLKGTNKTYQQTLTPEEQKRFAEQSKNPKPQPVVEETKPTTPPVTSTKDLTSVSGAEKGVFFKVQIAASHRLVHKDYFKRFNIYETVQIELHEGWHKYTIGHFNFYKDARDHRVRIWNTTPVKDAFVCAYSNGYRVTVQEALMITNQKWLK